MSSRMYFSSIKRWFISVKDPYKGLACVHDQHLIGSMVHNLYPCPEIIIRCP
ncbi:MAG: hypothetical protein ACMUEL_05295 [Flavobacteriales bacterium Tduv]